MSKSIILDSEIACQRLIRLTREWAGWLALGKPALEVTVTIHKEKRRLKQNAAYWAVIGDIEDQLPALIHLSPSKRDMDKLFRLQFLGIESADVLGKIIESLKEHKGLGVHEFSDYLQQVIVWAVEHEIVLVDKTHEQLKAAA